VSGVSIKNELHKRKRVLRDTIMTTELKNVLNLLEIALVAETELKTKQPEDDTVTKNINNE